MKIKLSDKRPERKVVGYLGLTTNKLIVPDKSGESLMVLQGGKIRDFCSSTTKLSDISPNCGLVPIHEGDTVEVTF